jgi:hypothetical protein
LLTLAGPQRMPADGLAAAGNDGHGRRRTRGDRLTLPLKLIGYASPIGVARSCSFRLCSPAS